jgi:predicted metalloprotease
MRWENQRRSDNIEDRRTLGGSRMRIGGGVGGIGAIVVVLVSLYFGVDPQVLLGALEGGSSDPRSGIESERALTPEEQRLGDFMAVVLADTEDTWGALFQASGGRYEPPRLVLFSEATQSGCGFAQSATGPFYCPADRKVYIDTRFFSELASRFKAPGDFAQAYVLAHEVGHHVQNLLGVLPQVQQAQARGDERQANALQVRVELQADCFAGIWAHHANRSRAVLEQGDLEEGIAAAGAVGDDRLQREAGRTVQPDTFTHGSSAQRVRWFRRGYESGTLEACDTLRAPAL